MDALLWTLAVVLIVVGVAGTVLPAIPGAVLVLAGAALGAWIDGFTRVSGWTIAVLAVLTVLSGVADLAAGALGAQRAGASRAAVVGAAIGTVAGVASGLWGLVFLPLAGAAVGEWLARGDLRQAGTVGVATWVGLLIGTAAKVAIVFVMVAVFVVAVVV